MEDILWRFRGGTVKFVGILEVMPKVEEKNMDFQQGGGGYNVIMQKSGKFPKFISLMLFSKNRKGGHDISVRSQKF